MKSKVKIKEEKAAKENNSRAAYNSPLNSKYININHIRKEYGLNPIKYCDVDITTT